MWMVRRDFAKRSNYLDSGHKTYRDVRETSSIDLSIELIGGKQFRSLFLGWDGGILYFIFYLN